MSEIKQHATYEEQIKKLRSRGCVISDNTACRLVDKQAGEISVITGQVQLFQRFRIGDLPPGN